MQFRDDQAFVLPDEVKPYACKEVLFDYAVHLTGKGYPAPAVMTELRDANETRCPLPLEDEELAAIATSATKYAECKEKSGFSHDAFGDMLIYCHHACLMDGVPMIWDGGSYQAGQDKVIRFAVDIRPSLKTSEIKELMNYLANRAPRVIASSSRYIAFRNCVVDLATGDTLENTPELHIPNLIPHNWNPDAVCPAVDGALMGWACGRDDTYAALVELVGLSLYRGREFQNGTFLTGTGANGKSTFLNLMMGLLGAENTSALDIWSLGERFQSNALAGVLANIGDDIANERLSGKALAVFKKVTAGNWVNAEIKGGRTYEFRPYATCIFSCNQMPRLADNSEGMYRRFRIIPFLATFSAGSASCDPRLEGQLSGEDAMERIAFLGVQALMRALERGSLTQVAEQNEMIDSIRRENSSVFQFVCEEIGYGTPEAQSVIGRTSTELHRDYQAYCDAAGLKPVSRNTFTTEIGNLYEVATERKRTDTMDGYKQCAVFVPKN